MIKDSQKDDWLVWKDLEDQVKQPNKEFIKIKVNIPKEKKNKSGRYFFDSEDKVIKTVDIPLNSPWSKTIAGISFREGYTVYESDVGKDLELVTDYNNKWDEDAIQIHFNNQNLGFCCQGVYKQWTATKVKKLLEMGYQIKARILSVNGGIPEFEKLVNEPDKLLELFADKYVLNFEKTFDVVLKYPNNPTKPIDKVSDLREKLNKEIDKDIDINELLLPLQNEWNLYKILLEEIKKLQKEVNKEEVKNIIKNQPQKVEELVELIKLNKYTKIKKLTGLNIQQKGVNYSLLVIPTKDVNQNTNQVDQCEDDEVDQSEVDQNNQTQSSKKRQFVSTQTINSKMGFYME